MTISRSNDPQPWGDLLGQTLIFEDLLKSETEDDWNHPRPSRLERSQAWMLLGKSPRGKKKADNVYINMTFQQTTPCEIRLKKRERQKKKKGKNSHLRTGDGNAAPCGFYLHPNTHNHPNVTLSLGIPFEFNVIMNVKSLGEGGGGEGGGGGRSVILQVRTRGAIFIACKGDVFFC